MTTKKVSRRKCTTRARMNRRRHTMRRRTRNTGGSGVGRLATIARQRFYHNIIPTLTRYNNMYTGEQLHPKHNSIVRHGDRYFNIMERVVDKHHACKESFQEAEKELKDPVKNFDKLKTLYDKVKNAKDDEKREEVIHNRIRPSSLQRSFMDSRISNPLSRIPIPIPEELYSRGRKQQIELFRTPIKTRGDDDEREPLLRTIKEKKPNSKLLTSPLSLMQSFAPTEREPNPVGRRIDFQDGDDDDDDNNRLGHK